MRETSAPSSGALPAIGLVTFLIGGASLVLGAAGAMVALQSALGNGTLALTQLLPVLPLAGWGYALRFLRWHLLIRRAVPALRLWPSFRAQAIGFGLSVTPGRVGELWKLHLVERATSQPASLAMGALLVERATDAIGFTVLMAIAATLASGTITRPMGASTVGIAVLLAIALALRPFVARYLGRSSGTSLLRQLATGSSAVLRPVPVGLALLALVVGRAGDGLLLWGVVTALGCPITPAFAILAFAAGGLAGGLSLLPGGIGAAEGTMVAVLATGGVPAEVGLLAALITRAFILWIWVGFGFFLFARDQFGPRMKVETAP